MCSATCSTSSGSRGWESHLDDKPSPDRRRTGSSGDLAVPSPLTEVHADVNKVVGWCYGCCSPATSTTRMVARRSEAVGRKTSVLMTTRMMTPRVRPEGFVDGEVVTNTGGLFPLHILLDTGALQDSFASRGVGELGEDYKPSDRRVCSGMSAVPCGSSLGQIKLNIVILNEITHQRETISVTAEVIESDYDLILGRRDIIKHGLHRKMHRQLWGGGRGGPSQIVPRGLGGRTKCFVVCREHDKAWRMWRISSIREPDESSKPHQE